MGRTVLPPRRAARRARPKTGYALALNRLEDRVTPALGTFELDGNAITQATHDWDQVYNDAALNPTQDVSRSIPGAVTFIHDPVNSATDDIFTGGQSTDINNLSSWHVGRGIPQSKGDIADVFASASEELVGGETHTIVHFGADRFDNNGNATLGFWFFQNPVAVNPNGTFSGTHTAGDILVVANFASSVASFAAYRWVGPGGSTSSLQQVTIDPADGFAIVNTVTTPTGGWPFQDKGGSPPNTFAPGEFFEAGLDLTALGLPAHLSTFLAETRASTSLNSALSDLVLGSFDTFAADLTVAKAVDDPTPNVGDTVTFTVTLTNQGPNDATGTRVADLLPAGLSLVSSNPAQGTYSATTGVWDVGTLARQASTTLALTARVDTPFARTNTAMAAADQTDRNPADNTASATVRPQVANLVVTKSVSDPTPNVGDTIAFTVTLTNAGPDPATNVALHDSLPAGLSFVSAAPSQGTYNSASGTWTVGTVIPGIPQTLTLTATVISPAAQTNTAALTQSDQFDPVSENNVASATETPRQADLQVTKAVSDPRPNVGDVVTFTVTVTNRGPDAATGVRLTDLVPPGVAFVSAAPSQGTYTPATGVWDVGTLAGGGAATLQLRATVVSPAAQTNTAAVTHADQFDPATGNNSASATETPQAADVQVTKSVDNPAPNVGDTITYTIVVSDNGPDPATNVVLTDVLPAGVAFVSGSATQGAYDPATGTWTVGTVVPGIPQTLTITATVVSAGVGANTASVSHADQFDPNTANNSDTASVVGREADLAVAKRVDNPRPNVGEQVTFTVTVSNTGPSDATGVQVTDLLPAGLSLVTANPSQGAYVAATGLWVVGSLPNGAQAALTLLATVVSPAAQTNVATITASDQADLNAGNDTASATETPQQADLVVSKAVSNPTPNVGDNVTFTVTLTNAGPDPATNVALADLLPPGLAFVSAVPSQGGYNAAAGVWAVGTVTPGTPQTLTITATVTGPAPQTNTAAVSHSDQFDPLVGNNAASATETPQQADLQVTKSVSDPTPNVGDVITFTVTVTNLGPDQATNVRVTDLLPPGLTPVLTRLLTGQYDPVTGVWDVGTLPAGQSRSIDFAVRVTGPTPQTNVAAVTHSDQFDPVTINNVAGATETPQQADLRVAKSVSNPTPNVGDVIAFTVTLTNAGPDAATGVLVTDLLPAGLAFVSAAPSQGSYAAGTGVWDVGTLAAGGTATLQLQARVVSPATLTNTATVTAADQFDPLTGNNTAGAAETPQASDLAVTKAATPRRVAVGHLVTFVVTVRNLGPGPAPGVVVSDRLPAGLTFVSARASLGAYSAATGVWTVGTLASGGMARLRLTARVTAVGTFRNTAAVTFPGTDPNLANNVAAVSIEGFVPVLSKRNLLGSAFGM